MAPNKKGDVQKNAWAWAENVSADYKISTQDVSKVYRMDLPKCTFGTCKRNCRSNPFCLSNIGESRWLSDAAEIVSDLDDPTDEKRQEKNFVGLKNLGATCYVNSLLQLWFHNSAFREAVFSWDPLQDTEECENPTLHIEDDEVFFTPTSVIGHLQFLFAMMALSKKKTVDPAALVKKLSLDTSEQQDAQEFSKLFLSLIENRLNPAVPNFIQQNFCGEYSYVTRCSNCLTESTRSSQFYELDLNIVEMKTLRESLADFLKEEKLDGDNKYFCGACNGKHDAERFIQLEHLPPTLCFQLMRFVYDRQKGRKKKLTSHLQFPETIDMTEYIEGAKRPYIYNLSAVLIHKGPTANSGHYIAHILTSQGWYKFNDESVESMEGKKLKFGEDDLDDFPKKSKAPRVPKGSLASSNAYMLVYTLQNGETNQNVQEEDSATVFNHLRGKLNPKVLRSVEEENSQFNKWVETVTECRNSKLDKTLQHKEEIASLIRLLPVQEDPFDVVSSPWLNQWLSNDDSKPVAPINNLPLLCAHKKLNPNSMSNAKYINSVAADNLYEKYFGGPRLKLLQDVCIDCINNEFSLIKLKGKTTEESKKITTLLSKIKMDENLPGYWVSKKSIKSWRKIVLERAEKQLNIKEEPEEPECCDSAPERGNGCLTTNSLPSECNSNAENNEPSRMCGGDSPIIGRKSKTHVATGSPTHSLRSNSLENVCRTLRSKTPSIQHKNNESSPSSEPPIDREKSENDNRNVAFKITPNSPSVLLSPQTLNRMQKVKTCFKALDDARKICEHVTKVLLETTEDEENMRMEIEMDKSMVNIASEVGSLKNRCRLALDYMVNKKRSKGAIARQLSFTSEASCRDLSPIDSSGTKSDLLSKVFKESESNSLQKSSKGSKNDLLTVTVSKNADSCDSDGDVSPVLSRGESSKRSNENEMVNGCTKKVKSESSVKIEEDDEQSGEFEDLNEDIVCEHGNLCFQENPRRLVPVEVWNILKFYFPSVKAFTKETEPCIICGTLACENEVTKGQLKQEASKQKELLSDLLGRVNNDLSISESFLDNSSMYLVSGDFILDWRKFIRDSKRYKQPSSIDNRHLFCECGMLLYNLKDEDGSMFVAVTEEEWDCLNSLYEVHGKIVASKDPETGTIVTKPDVCPTCLIERLEREHKEMLTYTNAKIYVRIVDNSDPGSDDSSSNPKKPKLNNGAAPYIPPGATNGCGPSAEPLEVRRSSRPRRGRREKEIVVSSDDTIKDVKVKIMNITQVAPFDQQLSKDTGERLDENSATLSSLGIFPHTTLIVKFTENAGGDACVSDFVSSAQVEAGFKGTELMKIF